MKVRIVQLLCPSRHCVVATAYESEDGEPIPEFTDRLRAGFEARVGKELHPWCGLCRSTRLDLRRRADSLSHDDGSASFLAGELG